ncbi:hypothetical protein D082_04390 [Synechocystis sp. PCC 6714]|nr:hypothetical protein D082_04390 [Synechocystis sp. PCC 6714]
MKTLGDSKQLVAKLLGKKLFPQGLYVFCIALYTAPLELFGIDAKIPGEEFFGLYLIKKKVNKLSFNYD